MLVHHTFLSPTHSSAQRFDAFCRTVADDLCLDWIHCCQLVLEVGELGCWPRDHDVATMCHPWYSLVLVMEQIPCTLQQFMYPLLEMVLPMISRAAHALLQHFTCSCVVLLGSFTGKKTSTCIIPYLLQ